MFGANNTVNAKVCSPNSVDTFFLSRLLSYPLCRQCLLSFVFVFVFVFVFCLCLCLCLFVFLSFCLLSLSLGPVKKVDKAANEALLGPDWAVNIDLCDYIRGRLSAHCPYLLSELGLGMG
jgi:hypothetical protein